MNVFQEITENTAIWRDLKLKKLNCSGIVIKGEALSVGFDTLVQTEIWATADWNKCSLSVEPIHVYVSLTIN